MPLLSVCHATTTQTLLSFACRRAGLGRGGTLPDVRSCGGHLLLQTLLSFACQYPALRRDVFLPHVSPGASVPL